MIRRVPADVQAVVSPLSVILALAMVQAGARGRTKTQINELISKVPKCLLLKKQLSYFPEANDQAIQNFYSDLSKDVLNFTEGVQTKIANAFFMEQKYAAKVEALDFGKPAAAAQV
ncbi:unnamed protein product [Strongylus vulgaris]|uniref:Serpin domain-containing protein n=1 Tax=Strongylus vulgaris TaxID=40348 RepID=A0A3P7J0G5_STRVU|nr:unnamed protein product [Strongylus vulgaris]